jgi:erythromycin esterase-like protein
MDEIQQMWSAEEIRQLILYTKELQGENEDLRAKMIAMDAYVKNGDAKIKQFENFIKQITYTQ